MEYYIYNIPVFLVGDDKPRVSIPEFCTDAEEVMAQHMLANVDVVYIGNLRELNGRNATFHDGAIYMTSAEPTVEDMMENFVHEVAHSLESSFAAEIYTPDLIEEYKAKRKKLFHILQAQGYNPAGVHMSHTEYSPQWDRFLADIVGYPTLLNLTMGLFASPYAATSIQEYFANGFEKYYLDVDLAWTLKKVSPVLFSKIEWVANV
jgi:hypothetical protein